MTKGRLLLFVFYAAGTLGFAVFIITKNGYLMDRLTASMGDNGDLYRFAKVRLFKTPLPPEEYADEDIGPATIDSARIFMIGDSFLESCRGHKALPVQLFQALGQPIHVVQAGDSSRYFNPLYLFRKTGVTKGPRRLVILERVERYIVDDFSDTLEADPVIDTGMPSGSSWDVFERRWFTGAERNYEVLLTSSSVTAPVIEIWNSIVFAVLGQISEMTPVYSLHPPFLFYEEEVSREKPYGFYYPHSDSMIKDMAEHIAAARTILKERFNTELIFMGIPNAYTLYHRFINDDTYDNYLPRLEEQLNKRGVGTIELYRKFAESKDIVYMPTDTHWNARGCAIALEQTLNKLRELGWDQAE